MSEPSSDEEAAHKPQFSVRERLVGLGADPSEIDRVKKRYPMKVTPYYAGLIRQKGDPIWRQCVPSMQELYDVMNAEDPLKEEEHAKTPYLVHKYPDRALLLVSNKCAMFCRFCTRKRKVGRTKQIPMDEVFKAIGYIREHPEIRDVIVSGGDPLMRPDHELEQVLAALRAIPHVQVIRIGTRMPCVQPARVTRRLVKMLKRYHPLYMNIHFNHPSEVTPEARAACELLANAGIPLGSQTVLLKGVNDSPEVMMELMHRLLQARVKPYYIYQCDLVKGCEHFRTTVETGMGIMKSMQGYTSGLCVPHFVVDTAGGKIPVSPQYVQKLGATKTVLANYRDELFTYPNPVNLFLQSSIARKSKRIGITFNVKGKSPEPGEPFDLYAEFDDMGTVNAIRAAIESEGYEVALIEADRDVVENLKRAQVDFVFNIAEGLRGDSRESQVPAILDMLGIPYSGSGVLTQAITLNKARKKEILATHRIPSPPYQLVSSLNDRLDPALQFPLFVKPNCEGSSKGITNDSLVSDMDALKRQVRYVIENYRQPALVESYCPGTEFTVGLIGNCQPTVLPIVQVDFDHLPSHLHKFDSYESKWIYDNPSAAIDPLKCPAPIDDGLKGRIEDIAVRTFNVLGCQDFCRIDLRLDSEGTPNVLDVNALPGMIPDPKENSRFPRACFAAGMSYDQMVLSVLHTAMRRHGMM